MLSTSEATTIVGQTRSNKLHSWTLAIVLGFGAAVLGLALLVG